MCSFFIRFFGFDRPPVRAMFAIVMFLWLAVFMLQIVPLALAEEGSGVLFELIASFFLGPLAFLTLFAFIFGRRNWKEIFGTPFWMPLNRFPKAFAMAGFLFWTLPICLVLLFWNWTGNAIITLILLLLSPLPSACLAVVVLWVIRETNKKPEQ